MELIPAASRAYVGGSTGNSALDLVLGYDGLGRIFGGGSGGARRRRRAAASPGRPGSCACSTASWAGRSPGSCRSPWSAWSAGLVTRLRAPRTDLARAAFLMWGGWLAVHAIVFSFMSGVIHSYYVVAMAPAVGALVGGGVVAMWRARERHPWVGAVLGLALVASAAVALVLLDRTPSFVPGLGLAVLAVTAVTRAADRPPAVVTRGRVPGRGRRARARDAPRRAGGLRGRHDADRLLGRRPLRGPAGHRHRRRPRRVRGRASRRTPAARWASPRPALPAGTP